MVRHGLVWLVLLVGATPGWTAWAESMFDELSHDFGSVPHGHLAIHPFRVVNRTGATVHISNIRVSCGCTSAQRCGQRWPPAKTPRSWCKWIHAAFSTRVPSPFSSSSINPNLTKYACGSRRIAATTSP